MLLQINSLSNPQYIHNYNNIKPVKQYPNLMPLNTDTVTFTGMSSPSEYKTVFQYLASKILAGNKAYKIDGSLLSSKKIGQAIQQLIDQDRLFLPYKFTNHEKIKWKSYIPEDIRVFSVDKINEARVERMKYWEEFLRYLEPISSDGIPRDPQLLAKIQKNPSLKLVIWDAVRSELKDSNRHIPVPFNERALLETIQGFEKIDPKDRAVRCASPSFLEMYTHRLRDNLLTELGVSTKQEFWVRIPSIKHDPANRARNIERLEILSCKNWCTRSSVDKAEAALQDGDFYIYLQRNKQNLWEPLVGMTTAKGRIDQIQGTENNNIVPLNLLDEIKSFISEKGLKCHSAIVDEGPKASQAIMISEKLSEVDVFKKTFAKAIKDNDDISMFKFLGVNVKLLDEDYLEIGTYRPVYSLNRQRGISVPYSMFGLNEDDLLANVRVINGDLILNHKNKIFESRITKFPPSLEIVTGRIHCTAEQYERFAADINRVIGDDKSKVIIHRL
ncbi:hypothetical protein IKL64_05605 [bacterium]|nr:hypothetical protein [bacterium]